MNRLCMRMLTLIPLAALTGLHFYSNQIKLETFQFTHFTILYSAMIPCFAAAYYLNKITPYPLVIILSFLVISAFPYVWSSPVLSDDAYRYIWEGHVQNRGYNPFINPPADPLFEGDPLVEKINFPEIPAVYPPLTQLIFRVLASVSLSMWFFKLFFLSAVIFVVLILYKNRKQYGDTFFVWSVLPLTIMETAWSAHFDPVGVLFLLISILFLEQSRGLYSGLFLAFSISIKWMPMIFLPVYLFSLPRKEWFAFFTSMLIVPLLYLPYLSAGKMLFFALLNFAGNWWHDGALYMLLKLTGLSEGMTRLILTILFTLSYTVIFYKIRDTRNRVYLILLALTHFSPVLWPWYLLWLVPFGVVTFPLTTISQALLSFASYFSLENGYISSNYAYTVLISVIRTLIVIIIFLYEYKKYKGYSKQNKLKNITLLQH